MPGLKKRSILRAVKVFHFVRMVIVACVCLLIGVSLRHLFDAYALEMIPFLSKDRIDAEVHAIPNPQQDLSISLEPVEPRWN
jgi:hypothetical protein